MRTETFNTPKPPLVTVKLPRGDIEIETSESEQTIVELAPEGDEERARRQIENSTVELTQRSDRDEVLVDCDPDDFRLGGDWFTITLSGRRAPIRVRVSAPNGTSLRIATGSADIRAAGRFGDVETKTGSGDISISEVEGDATIKVASGDVSLDRVGGSTKVQSASGDVRIGPANGTVDVKTASGDVSLDEAGEDVTVNSASGDVRVGSVVRGRVELKSVSGDMLIGVRRGSRVWMDVKTVTGDARSELAAGEGEDEDGSPLVELKATAMSGDIKIVRA